MKYFLFFFCAWWCVKTIYSLHCSKHLSFCLDMVLFPPGENCPMCIYFLMVKMWPYWSSAFWSLMLKFVFQPCIFNRHKQEAVWCISLGLLSPFTGVGMGLEQEQFPSFGMVITMWEKFLWHSTKGAEEERKEDVVVDTLKLIGIEHVCRALIFIALGSFKPSSLNQLLISDCHSFRCSISERTGSILCCN